MHDIVFENIRLTEETQHRHGDDGGWNGGGHRHAGKQAQIGVGSGQHGGQQNRQDDRFQCDFRQRDRGGNERRVYRLRWRILLKHHPLRTPARGSI